MAGLETCSACGRRLAPEAVKSAGGKPLCPPCYERAKAIVEEKRRRAAEEKKAAALKAKQEATRVKEQAAEESGAQAPGAQAPAAPAGVEVVGEPVIIPASGLHRAAKPLPEPDAEVADMLGSAKVFCILARVVAAIAMAGALLAVGINVASFVRLPDKGGVAGILIMIGSNLVTLVAAALPASLLWFLGGWINKISGLFARQLTAR
jgi:uncharacterized Zn finger protein (UPF0148 family)